MKTSFVVFTLLIGTASFAAPKVKKVEEKAAVASPASAPKKKLSQDISFSGSQVDGKYLSAGESIAEVEGDKQMGALIGIRKNFRDRLKQETARLSQSSATPSSGKGL